jgi:DNA processing protein
VTHRLVDLLVEHQWGIVSGLARGIDAESHQAALANDGYTVAVLANGLDRIYPAGNRDLAEEIVERGGALVSEQPFGVPARPANLIQGCRLQSGMSLATVVMQTDLSGALAGAISGRPSTSWQAC